MQFLYAIAYGFPTYPSEIEIDAAREALKSLALLFPSSKAREAYAEFLEENPPEPFIRKGRKSLANWVVNMHGSVDPTQATYRQQVCVWGVWAVVPCRVVNTRTRIKELSCVRDSHTLSTLLFHDTQYMHSEIANFERTFEKYREVGVASAVSVSVPLSLLLSPCSL